MSFYKRYELLRLIREGDAKSFTGRVIQTGEPILLHMVEGIGAASMRELAERARSSPGYPAIVECGDFAGSFYIVTEVIEPFGDLRQWLEMRASRENADPWPESAPPPAAPPEPRAKAPDPVKAQASKPAPPKPKPGEFTAIFGAEAPPATNRQPASSEFSALFGAQEHPPADAPPPPQPAAGQPGEFTQLFGGSAAPENREFSSPLGTSAPPASPPSPRDIGEFAKVFNPPPKPEPPPPPKKAEDPGLDAWPEFGRAAGKPIDSGEFTRFFGSSIPAESINVEAEQARHAQLGNEAGAKPFQKASEFTRQFGPAPGETQKPILPPRPLQTSLTDPLASKIFKSEDLLGNPATPPVSPPKSGSAIKPSEYTRMISGDDAANIRAQVAGPPSGIRAPRPQPAWVKALLVLGGVVSAVLLGVLFYLVLSRFAPH